MTPNHNRPTIDRLNAGIDRSDGQAKLSGNPKIRHRNRPTIVRPIQGIVQFAKPHSSLTATVSIMKTSMMSVTSMLMIMMMMMEAKAIHCPSGDDAGRKITVRSFG